MTRRRFFVAGSAVALGTGVAACGVSSRMAAPTPPAPAWPALVIDLGPVRVTAIRTGSVAVKHAHRAYGGPAALRLPAIALDPRWTPWLPVTCWLVEHPEGPILVDTGETARVAEPGYFACDAGTQWVYERLLRFDVPPDVEVGPQLQALGVPPSEVRTVVLTHLHSDHAGGLRHVPNARLLLSATERARQPQGALPCRWPDGFRPEGVRYSDGPFGAFTESYALTTDGAVRLVPTPGHTRGHQSVMIQHDGAYVLLAGDASFSRADVEARTVAGICETVPAARRTLAVLNEQLAGAPTVFLASHDPDPTLRP